MTLKIPGNRTYAVGTASATLGGLSLALPEGIADIPLPTTIEGACALLLTVLGLGLVTLRMAIRDSVQYEDE